MAIFIVDYGYCAGSHHHSSACSLWAAAARRGVPFQLLAPSASDLARSLEPPASFVLSHRLYDHPLGERRGLRGFWSEFSARRAAVRRDLRRHLDGRIASGDTVLLNTPMAPEFAGFADWHEALPAASRPAAAAHFLLPLGYGLAPDLAWQEDFALVAYREAFGRLSASCGSRSLYLAHPPALAARLAAFEPRIAVCPSPFALPPAAPASPAELSIAFLGRGKAEKGIDMAFAAFDRLQAARAPFRWIFQTAPLELAPERLSALRAPNVTHAGDFATPSGYAELLRSASIAVLPYDPRAYKTDQGSGILCEALAMGIPVICSAAEYFVEQLARLGFPELVFRPYTGEALAAKIVEIAAAYPRYREAFAAQAGASEGRFAPEHLLDRLRMAALGTSSDTERAAGMHRAANGAPAAAGPGASFLSLLGLRLRALSSRPASRRKSAGAAGGAGP